MRKLTSVALALAPVVVLLGCDEPPPPTAWPADEVAIVLAEGAAEAVAWAGSDLRSSIAEATGTEPELVSEPAGTGARYLLLVGEGPWPCPPLDEPEAYALVETTHRGKPALALCGGGLLGRQYAVYAYLFALGFRFVHPEQSFVPELAALPAGLPAGLTDEVERPGLWLRGFHSHTQHPLELLEALLTDDPDEAERAYRYVDWLVRNRQNTIQWILLDSVPEPELLDQAARVVSYAHRRGLYAAAVSSFNEGQQNAHRLIDTGDGVDDLEQLRASLDSLLAVPWDSIVLNLGASEFSATADLATVGWMDETVRHLAGVAPGVRVYASNHVPAGMQSETYGVSFYDLPMFADPGMGTYVHTTMCYGLEGPAPVYGNSDFSRQLRFLLDQVDDRGIVYFPESAWWLTFDDMIPLFLPVYVHVRSADLRLVGAVDGLEGHVTFTSGWEWGYWLTDLAIAYQSWRPAQTTLGVLGALLDPVHPELAEVVERMARAQYDALVEDRLMPFLTAEDLPTEIGYRAGVVFHALAPAPADVMAYDEGGLRALDGQLEALEAHCEELAGFGGELERLAGPGTTPFEVLAPEATAGAARRPAAAGAAPILEELRDGAVVTGARCWNAFHNYRALVSARRAALGLEAGREPAADLAEAAAMTALAREVVARRESAYRYEPQRTSDHEETGGAGVDNVTDYPYRVFGRTHVLFFWERRDRLVAEAVAGSSGGLLVAPQQLLAGTELTVDASAAGFSDGTEVVVLWGEGGEDRVAAGETAVLRHLYPEPSQPTFRLEAEAEGESIVVELALSVATEIYSLPSARFRLIEPPDPMTEAVLRPFLPTLQLGWNGDDPAALPASVAYDRDDDGVADHGSVVHLPPGTRAGDRFRFEGFGLTVPVESASGRFGTLFLRDVLLELELSTTVEPGDAMDGSLRAAVAVDDLVALLAATGVLEREDVLVILADIFGFDASAPPATVTVELAVAGERIAAAG